VTDPKNPFKSKAMTSDQTDSDKTPQKEKVALLHFVVLKKSSRFRDERKFTSTLDQRALSLFLPRAPEMKGGSDLKEQSSSPKKLTTQNQIIGSN